MARSGVEKRLATSAIVWGAGRPVMRVWRSFHSVAFRLRRYFPENLRDLSSGDESL
jgi:hypothetical protein